MSYEILYRARFIKYKGCIIPVLEMGSNNCWSWDNKSRARDFEIWSTLRPAGAPWVTAEDLLADIEAIRTSIIERNKLDDSVTRSEYKDDAFSYWSSIRLYGHTNTTWSMFRGYFRTAIRQAKTIEEWKELGVTFYLHPKYGHRNDEDVARTTIQSTDDLDKLSDTRYTLDCSGDIRRPFRNWHTEYDEQDHYFVVEIYDVASVQRWCRGELIRNTRYGYKYTYGGTKYRTKAAANRAARNRAGFEVKRVDEPAKFRRKVYASSE